MHSFTFSAFARNRTGGASAELQKLFENSGASLEEVLRFPNVVSELQGSVDTRGYFTSLRIETIIRLVFEPESLNKYSFEDARKISYVASEMLSTKIPAINEFFFHSAAPEGRTKKSSMIDEIDGDFDFEGSGHKDLLLSPANSVKSKSTTTVESYNKTSLDLLMTNVLDEDSLDDTRAGYFTKILIAFMQKYKNELLNYVFKSGFDYKKLAAFPESFSLADLLCNVALFENSLSNDSIIFHESQSQIANDHVKARVELLKAFLISDAIVENSEAAANARYVIEELFNKFKNINESDTLFIELFGTENLLEVWLDFFLRAQNDSVRFELVNCFKLFGKFVQTGLSGKNEIFSEAIKTLIQKQGPAGMSAAKLVRVMCRHFIITSEMESRNKTFITTYKGTARLGTVKTKIAFLEALIILLKQKTLPVYEELINREFFAFLFVK